MAGKSLAFASARLGFALDRLSKNTLIDLVINRARYESGLSTGRNATDEDIVDAIQRWLEPVQKARGDRCVSLLGQMLLWDRKTAEYIAQRDRAANSGLLESAETRMERETGITPEAIREANQGKPTWNEPANQ